MPPFDIFHQYSLLSMKMLVCVTDSFICDRVHFLTLLDLYTIQSNIHCAPSRSGQQQQQQQKQQHCIHVACFQRFQAFLISFLSSSSSSSASSSAPLFLDVSTRDRCFSLQILFTTILSHMSEFHSPLDTRSQLYCTLTQQLFLPSLRLREVSLSFC